MRRATAMGRVSLGLLAFGIVGGSLADTHPPTEPERRGDYLVLRGDFHVHTRLSDGFLSPFDLPMAARREGLQVIAVTEHNWVWPSKLARWASELLGGPIVLTGAEITTHHHHLIAVGIERDVSWRLPIEEVVAAIHAQGGVAIAAHPGRRFWPSFERVLDVLDGSEVMHPIAFRGEASTGWLWTDMVAFWEQARDRGLPLAAIGSSDFHFFKALGSMHTLVFAREATPEGVMEALRARRTVAVDLEGRSYSAHPELVALLEADPLPQVRKDRTYAHEGALDLAARTAGWLGLLGLVVFRRRRRRGSARLTALACPRAPPTGWGSG